MTDTWNKRDRKKMIIEELNKILENHKHWIRKDRKQWEKMRANLREAELCGVNLYGADLHGANLYRAVLYEVNLREANLHGANLREADLRGADLRGTDLYKADLYGANLSGAALYGANLHEANLHGAILYGANLCGADLREANLHEANLHGANLHGADLRGAENIPFIPYACPDIGRFTGFKKASGYIVALEIPEDARRLSATGRKCRCDKAKVLQIQNLDGSKADVEEVVSNYDSAFVYRVGEIVNVSDFNEDRWSECSTGIHFFINRQEAVEYY